MFEKPMLNNVLLVITGLMMILTLALIFLWVPTEKNLGVSQRIFYVHVPVAWVGFLSFFIVLIGSIGYLWKQSGRWDRIAHASAELGVLFTSLMLMTGIFWAKPIWGVWWTWDPRLTTSLILWLIYVAYIMLRAYTPNRDQAARYAAILGIFGFIDVPIVYLSIVWWRTVHPQALIGPAASGDLESSMRLVLLTSTAAFTILFAVLLGQRTVMWKMEEELDIVRDAVEAR